MNIDVGSHLNWFVKIKLRGPGFARLILLLVAHLIWLVKIKLSGTLLYTSTVVREDAIKLKKQKCFCDIFVIGSISIGEGSGPQLPRVRLCLLWQVKVLWPSLDNNK